MAINSTKHKGNCAEASACKYLEQHGLSVISRNYRCKSGEIDIIMQKDSHVVFVEVRLRNNTEFGSGLESITRHKKKRLITAAMHFLQQNPAYGDAPCRFDVISITGSPSNYSINWVRDAFVND